MESELTETFGYLAAACTTFAFVPQAIRVWRTRSAEDISLAMYVILVAGVMLWIIYGARIHSLPVVAANVVSLLLAGAVLAGKLRFRRRPA
jgi:MtN3 and saliva related transmembrane protein